MNEVVYDNHWLVASYGHFMVIALLFEVEIQ